MRVLTLLSTLLLFLAPFSVVNAQETATQESEVETVVMPQASQNIILPDPNNPIGVATEVPYCDAGLFGCLSLCGIIPPSCVLCYFEYEDCEEEWGAIPSTGSGEDTFHASSCTNPRKPHQEAVQKQPLPPTS